MLLLSDDSNKFDIKHMYDSHSTESLVKLSCKNKKNLINIIITLYIHLKSSHRRLHLLSYGLIKFQACKTCVR